MFSFTDGTTSTTSSSSGSKVAEKNPFQSNVVELENDELNQHECMAPMVAIIKHMYYNKIGKHHIQHLSCLFNVVLLLSDFNSWSIYNI